MTYYDRIASNYAAFRRINSAALQKLISNGKTKVDSHVLEVGCGTANYAGTLNERVGCTTYATDPSVEMLSVAKKRFPSVVYQVGRAEELDFSSNSLDLVFSVDVIHHISDRPSYFHEAFRILKHKGLICTVTESDSMIRTRQPQSVYFPESIEVELTRYPPISEIQRLLCEAGFVDIHEESVSGEPEQLTDAGPYRTKVLSSLQFISEENFQRGLSSMELDLKRGPIASISTRLLIFGTKP